MKKIAILGGTGFIGRHLIDGLVKEYKVIILTRSHNKHKLLNGKNIDVLDTDYNNADALARIFSKVHGVINLAGESVGSRWTKNKKERIYNSRIHTNKAVTEAFKLTGKKPAFMIQASGIGIYGKTKKDPDETITEVTQPFINGFLAKVSNDSENTVKELNKITRLIYIRTGIVLDKDEGALPQMALPFKFFVGGPLGNGKQWNSWIHINDEVRAIKFLIQNEQLNGVFNLTAPNPVTNAEMSRAIAKAINKPSFITAPAFALKSILGEMADELLLHGLKVLPQRLADAGFEFKYNSIDMALGDIFS